MWIEISDEFYSDIQKKIEGDKICGIKLVVSNLMHMMIKCKHIVYFSRDMLRMIKDNFDFSQDVRECASWILRKYIYLYSWKNSIKHKIIVCKRSDIIQNNNTFFVPPSFFIDEKPTKLIVENESDCYIYKGIYKHVKKTQKNNTYYDIHFENDSCHGSNVASKIREVSCQDGIGLVYLDSDQDYEGGARGNTYRDAADEMRNCRNKVFELNVLSVREKENLFSPKMYIPFCDLSKKKFLTKLGDYNDKNIYYYFDIKDGIKYGKFNDNEWRKHYNTYISKFVVDGVIRTYKNIHNDDICSESIGDKVCDRVCKILLTIEDKDFDFKRIKKDYRYNADDILKMRKNIEQYLPSELYDEWKKIYNVIGDWGICLSENQRYRIEFN